MHRPRDPVRTSSCLLLKPDRVPTCRQVLTFRHFRKRSCWKIAAILSDPRACSHTGTFQVGLRRVRHFFRVRRQEDRHPPDAEGTNKLRFLPKLGELNLIEASSEKLRRNRPAHRPAAWVLRSLSSRMPAARSTTEILNERGPSALPSSLWKIAALAVLGSLLFATRRDGCKCVALPPRC